MTAARSWAPFGLILAGYLALSLGFQRATPPLEASDEARHFGYVLALKEQRALPVADPARPTLAGQEATQPPLYYVLGALLVSGIDTSDAPDFLRPRAGSPIGRADLPGPRDMFLRPDEASSPDGTRLAVRWLRLFSMALGAATIGFTHAIVRSLAPIAPDIALFAAAFLAFNPMFLFVANAVNNDVAVVALGTAIVWWTCRSAWNPTRPRVAAGLGACIGVATLAKASGLVFLPIALYRLLAARPGLRRGAIATLASAAGFGAIAGPWLARGVWLYGDPLGVHVHGTLVGNLRASWQPLAVLREWSGFVKSFWGVFGAFNVIYPDSVYWGFYALTIFGALAITSLAIHARLRKDVRLQAMGVLVVANLSAVALWTSRLLGSQGRLLFPALPAIVALVALGCLGLDPHRRIVFVAVPLGLFAGAAYAAGWLIPASYAAR